MEDTTVKTENETLAKEDPSVIDDKEKLGAFAIKNLLLYWKRVAVILAIIGGVVLLTSGYSCTYKGLSCSKTPTTINNAK